MKKLLAPLFSQGMLVFAGVLFALNLLSFLYFDGFKSFWLVVVVEFTAILAYVISRLGDADSNIWNFFKPEE